MKKVILITGSTGFVGRQVLNALGRENVVIWRVVREKSETEGFVKADKLIVTPDLFSESVSWWASICEGVDIIIHVAWYTKPGKYLQSPKNIDCLIGTLNMAKGAMQAEVKRFIGVGTCFEYDMSGGFLSINTPLKPLTSYAAAKAAVYFGLSQSLLLKNVEFAWCRLFYLYGEGEDATRLVPHIRNNVSKGKCVELTDGNQIRDFLDVSEAGERIASVALSTTQGAVNICSGIPVTIRALSEKIAGEYNRCDLLKFGARPDNLFDPPCVVGIKTDLIE